MANTPTPLIRSIGAYNITRQKICQWPGCTEEITGRGNKKYCSEHRLEAKRERTRIRAQRHYKNNKLRKKLKNLGSTTSNYHLTLQPGPTYLGQYIPFHEFYCEYLNINKLKNITFSKSVRTKGEIAGLNGTHQYVTGDDYHSFNVSYTMQSHTRCINPECPTNQFNGANSPILLTRDLKHCETVCQTCGTVLNHPGMSDHGGGRMAMTTMDIYKSNLEQQSIQTIAWNGYWKHSGELLERLK